MTHRTEKKSRPSVLLVALRPSVESALAAVLRDAGYDVVRTRSRPAGIVYGNKLAPDLVLSDDLTARLLCRSYPDGPFWGRAKLGEQLAVLHGTLVDRQLLVRIAAAFEAAELAARTPVAPG